MQTDGSGVVDLKVVDLKQGAGLKAQVGCDWCGAEIVFVYNVEQQMGFSGAREGYAREGYAREG
ncbi:hypothetical protein [Corynebacterium glaucum]|uniref:hypothetical protein n=1 Tax=Corynebacterium glaucum TaxID=187491 RepID=UPI0025B62419|nr:hypothetical protein [Corynebacterium glaucum]